MEPDARLLTARELRRLGEEHPERRLGDRGDLARLRRGVYAEAGDWRNASLDERYKLRIRAAGERLQAPVVFSHESALRLLGLPALRPWPPLVHVSGERRSGGRSEGDIIKHCVGVDPFDVVTVDALLCTSPARTALDIALTRTFAEGVVVADAVFARYAGAREDFAEMLRLLPPGSRGIRRAARVRDFANPLAQSVGESWSRVVIAELGYAAPELQVPIEHHGRTVGIVDFAWPGIVGEFDGDVKYKRLEYRKGRSPEQVVIDEKNRENEIRRAGRNMARWIWDDLRDRRRLDVILAGAGVPRQLRT